MFYAVGTGIGGVAGPALFGALIDSGSRDSVFAGYCLGSALMIAAALIGWRYGIAAERREHLADVRRAEGLAVRRAELVAPRDPRRRDAR